MAGAEVRMLRGAACAVKRCSRSIAVVALPQPGRDNRPAVRRRRRDSSSSARSKPC